MNQQGFGTIGFAELCIGNAGFHTQYIVYIGIRIIIHRNDMLNGVRVLASNLEARRHCIVLCSHCVNHCSALSKLVAESFFQIMKFTQQWTAITHTRVLLVL